MLFDVPKHSLNICLVMNGVVQHIHVTLKKTETTFKVQEQVQLLKTILIDWNRKADNNIVIGKSQTQNKNKAVKIVN